MHSQRTQWVPPVLLLAAVSPPYTSLPSSLSSPQRPISPHPPLFSHRLPAVLVLQCLEVGQHVHAVDAAVGPEVEKDQLASKLLGDGMGEGMGGREERRMVKAPSDGG